MDPVISDAVALHGEERNAIRDVRRQPIEFAGYLIGYQNGYPHVRIEQERYRELKGAFLELALHRSAGALEGRIPEPRL